MKAYSITEERAYYERKWPVAAQPYLHLEPYLSSWLNVGAAFRGARVLDIGAGECVYTRLIAERFEPSSVVACELFAERMRPAMRDNRDARVAFVSGDCFRLPFRAGSFDVVFGSLVLSQLPGLAEVVREIARVLAPRGIYVGIEPNPLNLLHLTRFFFRPRSHNQYLLGRRHLAAFERAGFQVQSVRFWGRHPEYHFAPVATLLGVVASRESQAQRWIHG
jgi:SAM-dependent methyltransferase